MIAELLIKQAAARPDAFAVIEQNSARHMNFRELNERSNRLAIGFADLGIVSGMRVAVMIKPSIEFVLAVYALFKIGAVLVAVDPGLGVRRLGKALSHAAPQAFIGIARAHLARILLGWGRASMSCPPILAGRGYLPGHIRMDACELAAQADRLMPALPRAEADAAILFTSGSTGIPKGAMYTHANFSAQVRLVRDLYRIEPGEVELASFPLFALFGPALGMTTVIPDMDPTRPGYADPGKFAAAIERYQGTSMFASPALLRRLVRGMRSDSGLHRRFASLRRVISAGAPISDQILRGFMEGLPKGARMYTPYGATEALPVASISADEILQGRDQRTQLGRGVCVGRAVPGVDVQIIPICDAPIAQWLEELALPTGEIGEIAVSGPQVTRSYCDQPEATQLSKIACADGGYYHRMGDVGYWDEQGYLWYCGRKSQRVELLTGTLFTAQCEEVFNLHPQIARTALVKVGTGETCRAAICIELEPGEHHPAPELLFAELRELGQQCLHTRLISDFLIYPKPFPVDIRHNAKIERGYLATWARRRI
ncbi:MAG: fatty acid CoA ligase family protein [Candidatus Eutrophobiaceae bacterium]